MPRFSSNKWVNLLVYVVIVLFLAYAALTPSIHPGECDGGTHGNSVDCPALTMPASTSIAG